MIYITGDTHGGFQRFGSKYFPQQTQMGRNDYMIICGDFGGLWDGGPKDWYWLDWLSGKPFTTLFVDGNHENFDLLRKYPKEQWNGGVVQKITPHVIHLCRGEIFNLQGKTFFAMGGAESTDKMFRKEGLSWWKEEMPSREEMERAIAALEQNHWRVDYVITHCAPRSVQTLLASWYENDPMVSFLDRVCSDLTFKRWFFGHYHVDKQVNEQFIALYNKVIPMEW